MTTGLNASSRIALDHSAADDALIARAVGLGCAAPCFDRAHYPEAFAAWERRANAVITRARGARASDDRDVQALIDSADLWSGNPGVPRTAAPRSDARPA